MSFLLSLLVSLSYSEELLFILTKPLLDVSLDQNDLSSRRFIFTDITEVFITYIRISLSLTVLLQIPLIFYQSWLFVKPGLYQKEYTFLRAFFIGCILFLFLGLLFMYFFAIPIAWNFFIGYEKNAFDSAFQLQLEAKVNEYVFLVLTFFLAASTIFQLPVVLITFVYLKIIQLRQLIDYRKIYVVVVFSIGAFCSPPDILSQLLLAIPLVFFYECIVFGNIIYIHYKLQLKKMRSSLKGSK
jgi:sec-independent protein translocase protein TatC